MSQKSERSAEETGNAFSSVSQKESGESVELGTPLGLVFKRNPRHL